MIADTTEELGRRGKKTTWNLWPGVLREKLEMSFRTLARGKRRRAGVVHMS